MGTTLTWLRRKAEDGGALIMSDAGRVRFERRLRGMLEARRLRHADAVVVSFGKAGRTWLRVMMSHFYKVKFGLAREELIGFDNLHRQNAAIPRILFTHDNYLGDWTGNRESKEDYRGRPVVLQVRHPADTAVSQYHQWSHRMRPHKKLLNDYPPHGTDISRFEFVMGDGGGIPKIVRFMNSWAEAARRLENVLVVRYEDLRSHTAGELGRVLAHVGTPGDEASIQDAVDYASFEKMRARESKGEVAEGSGTRLTAADPSNPDSFKTRRAKVGGYRDDFEADELASIDDYIDTHLDPVFGYTGQADAAAPDAEQAG